MNILVIDNFDNITRCAAIFVEDQIKEFHKQGHNVRVLIPIAWGKKDFFKYRLSPIVREVVIDDIPHVFVRYLSASRYGNDGFNTKSVLKTVNLHLNKILNGFIPDVIHAHKLGFGSNIGAEIKRRYSCPLVVTTHGSDALIPIKLGLEKNICAWSNEADALVAVSSRIERMVISTGTKTKTYVILNGHVCRDFINDTRHRKFPITILQVSSLIPQKKVDITIDAFSKLCKDYPEAHLYIVGSGPERNNLKQQCKSLGLGKKVTFTGQVSNDEVLSLMSLADYFVMPSVEEGFGIVYIEAMSQKCLTIGTQNEGIEDVIRNGENGYLVSPNDSIQICTIIDKCLKDKGETMKIVERGARDADSLTWRRNAEEYIELFQMLIG